MLDKAAAFIKECNPEDTTVVYHGGCGDGIAAAAVLLKAFQKHFGVMPQTKFASPGVVSTLNLASEFIIFADLAVDQEKDYVLRLAEKSKILVLDHHQITNNLNNFGVLHVHPDLFSKIPGVRYPGAKLAYDVCSLIADISDADWLVAIGLVHDIGAETWKDFLKGVFAKYKELGKFSTGFESKLGELVSIITASQEIKRGNELALRILLEAERPSDILEEKVPEVSELIEINKAREKEVQYYIDNFEKLADIDEKLGLAIYDIDLKNRISSALSTALSLKYPDLLIIVINKESPSVLKLNFRQTKEKIDCNWLAKASTEAFGGQGGGHKPAAGGRIHPKFKEKFKDKIRELVKQRLGK